jgi:hypothetical protein
MSTFESNHRDQAIQFPGSHLSNPGKSTGIQNSHKGEVKGCEVQVIQIERETETESKRDREQER